MAVKVRKQISIERDQEVALKRLARETGLSEAELIREALQRGLDAPDFPYPNEAAWQREVGFIEGLIAKGPVQGRRAWRREDAYED